MTIFTACHSSLCSLQGGASWVGIFSPTSTAKIPKFLYLEPPTSFFKLEVALYTSLLDFTGSSSSLGPKQSSALPKPVSLLCIPPGSGLWKYPELLSHSLHPGSLQDLFSPPPKNSWALFHSSA